MTTYFKAVRPDGTDFHTGTIDYLAGGVIKHPNPARSLSGADASGYLSVATVPTDCTGFRWPARLLEVEAVGRTAKDVSRPNKRHIKAVRVIRELPAYEMFGPQGEHVVALIERAGKLTVQEAERLSAARSAARYAAWDAAWYAAWDAARSAARDAAWDAARYAARDAALALVVRDLIGQHGFTQKRYDTLTGLWRRTVGKIHPDDEEMK